MFQFEHIIPCRTSVAGSTASTMAVATATPTMCLPWMAPHVEQGRLAANHVSFNEQNRV